MSESPISDEVLSLDGFDACSANSSFTVFSDVEDVANSDFKIPLLVGEQTLLEGPSADGHAVLTNYRLYHKGYEGDNVLNVPLGLVSHVRVKGGVMFVFCKNGRSYSLAFHLEDVANWVNDLQSKLNNSEMEDLFAFRHFFDQAKPPSECPEPSNGQNGSFKLNGNQENSSVSNGTNGNLKKTEYEIAFGPRETEISIGDVCAYDDDGEYTYFRTSIYERKPTLRSVGFLQIYDVPVLGHVEDAFTKYKNSLFEADNSRMNFNFKDQWRISSANKYYELCSSYPQYIITPSSIRDSELEAVSKYRRAKRLPAVVWRHQKNGCVIARCSQPGRGILGYNNEMDQKLVAAIRESCLKDAGQESSTLLIVDARSNTAAIANRACQGGYEDVSYYPNCEIAFLDIENIHKVRDSLNALGVLCATPDKVNWLTELDNTRWMSHISSIIQGALVIVNAVNDDARPVLVHCSDGWDRTSQLTSLAQLLMDPFYRTMEGFKVLVEREWLSFGHKFADRCGNWKCTEREEERSPVFLQWLDCVFQLTHQFPCHFEFNEHYLIRLAIHTYSGLFGTFLCNTDKERFLCRQRDQTLSVWPALGCVKEFYNDFYCENSEIKVFRPSSQIRNLKFWSNMYLPNNFVHKNIFKLLPAEEKNVCKDDLNVSGKTPPRKTSSPKEEIEAIDAKNPLETSNIPVIKSVQPEFLEMDDLKLDETSTLLPVSLSDSAASTYVLDQDFQEPPSSLGPLDLLSSILPNLYSMYDGWCSVVPSFSFYGGNGAERCQTGKISDQYSKHSGPKQGNGFHLPSKWVFEAKAQGGQKRHVRFLDFDGLFIQEDFASGMARMFRSKMKKSPCKCTEPADPELDSSSNS